ncbi:MAG TPA: hypothetical protein VHP14_12330 [Anaerolineales bacterium]|nr:hypothetical protein [Anaerolineales bacterium]
MESLIDRWAQMRRWERGLVLGNIFYFTLAACGHIVVHPYGEYMDLSEGRAVFVLFIGITTEAYMLPLSCIYYGVWCGCSALFVQWLGEKAGMIVLFLLVTLLGFAILVYYTLATFSLSW